MKEFRLIAILAVATLTLATLTACAADRAAQNAQQNIDAMAAYPQSRSLSGNYLAARFAQRQSDWSAAENYMNEVVGLGDVSDIMLQKTFLLTLGAGNHPKARALAEKIIGTGEAQDIAAIYLAADALAREDFAAATNHIARISDGGFGRYTKPLLTVWTEMGLGHKDKAQEILTANNDENDPSFHIHSGLIAELSGDMNGAAEHYKVAMQEGLTLHTAVMVGSFFERYGQPEYADMIYESLGRLYPFNPFVSALAGRDRQRLVEPNIHRPADGAAFALFELATLLYEKKAYDSAKIYGSMVQMLAPQSPFAALMMGDIAALQERHDEAVAAYLSIAETSPLFWLSRMRVSEVRDMNGQIDAAVGILADLAQNPATRLQALSAIGDIYRRHENFSEALKAYDAALTGLPEIAQEHWPLVYARGIALERLNNWDRAEKDLLQALKFQPDNPMILNFIGYSWADKGLHLDKALEYICKAVNLRPDDGYILDSYAWALYRVGRYEEAAEWIERAVGLVPGDPTLLDHLGDIYWHVGRHQEARYGWQRAADLSQDNTFKAGLLKKMQKGPVAPKPMVAQKEAKI